LGFSLKDNEMTTITTTPRTNDSPFTTWKVDHSAIRVPDFEAAVAWYTNKLDFRLLKHLTFAGLTFAFLEPAGGGFVFELLAGLGAEARPKYEDLHDSYRLAGWHHVCFRVSNVDEAIEQLRKRSVKIVSEPHDVAPMGLRVAFFSDPWGNLFEFTQLIAGSTESAS
jgi:catechol 2,3-dioxygenase-like lactoylglutathione lyase family enzyme